jgi:nitrite reductase/ring-hydroxylating ferredoxin subunit
MPEGVFIDVGTLDQIPHGSGRTCHVADISVAVFRAGERLYAIDDACLRCGNSLSRGALDGTHVTCACGWRYDLARGCVPQVPGLWIDRYDVKVVDAHVCVARRPRLQGLASGDR